MMEDRQLQRQFEQAMEHHRAGRLAQAESLYREILRTSPGHPDALHLLGLVAHQSNRHDTAIDLIRRAVDANPGNADYYNNLGAVLMADGQVEPAIGAFRQAMVLRRDFAEAAVNYAHALRKAEKRDQAIEAYRQALRLNPRVADAKNNLGNLLQEKGELEEAEKCFRAAIQLRPKYPEALNNLANLLAERDRLDEAIQAYRQSLALRSDAAETHNNLGQALQQSGRVREAEDAYRQAVSLKPDLPNARWNLSLVLLLQGHFDEGWQLYESRWDVKDFKSPRRKFRQPMWDRRNLNGQGILLHAEQGFGDTIQFCRYAPLVAARGGRVILDVPAELRRLLQSLPGVDQIVQSPDDPIQFDWHCPLMSLPLVLKTTLQSIPTEIPYLGAEPALIERWRELIGPRNSQLQVGLAWVGKPIPRHRSIASAALAPLSNVTGVRFHSLHKQEKPTCPPGMALTDWSHELHDFAETAALLENLDLVICIDTAVAHLAGALGKKTWMLLPFAPDFRWMLKREDSPWYPTMRLFRQPKLKDWGSVISRVVSELTRLARNQ